MNSFIVVLTALGLVAAGGLMLETWPQDERGRTPGHPDPRAPATDQASDAAAKAAAECAVACASCAAHCANQVAAGETMHLETMRTCLDCADICSAAAMAAARGGTLAQFIVRACAESCAACATACERIPDDAHMRACAEACRRCEQACLAFLKTGAPTRNNQTPGAHDRGEAPIGERGAATRPGERTGTGTGREPGASGEPGTPGRSGTGTGGSGGGAGGTDDPRRGGTPPAGGGGRGEGR
ncbi:MAG TPA: four-helix bundle copper-binding protein [Planctomycetota bacterium]|nr:four-helix bundle copper-binding protein [Planctomycetota bacterium]